MQPQLLAVTSQPSQQAIMQQLHAGQSYQLQDNYQQQQQQQPQYSMQLQAQPTLQPQTPLQPSTTANVPYPGMGQLPQPHQATSLSTQQVALQRQIANANLPPSYASSCGEAVPGPAVGSTDLAVSQPSTQHLNHTYENLPALQMAVNAHSLGGGGEAEVARLRGGASLPMPAPLQAPQRPTPGDVRTRSSTVSATGPAANHHPTGGVTVTRAKSAVTTSTTRPQNGGMQMMYNKVKVSDSKLSHFQDCDL